MSVFSTMDGLLSFQPSVLDLSTPPEVPRNKVISQEVKAESVFITWNPPPGNLEYYEVVYYPTDRDFGRLRQRVWEPRVNLTTLDPGSAYQTEIHAISNELVSDPLKAIVYTKPLPPNNVITIATEDTILVSWETVYFDGGAVIQYYTEDLEGGVVTERIDPGVTEYSITGLDPGTNYIITVSTYKNEVESEPVLVTIKTKGNATETEGSRDPTASSDNIPISPKVAATEEVTATKSATRAATTTTTTTPGEAALVAETTAETETIETTTAPETNSREPTTTGRQQETEDPATDRTPTTASTDAKSTTVSTTQDTVTSPATTSPLTTTTTETWRVETTKSGAESNTGTTRSIRTTKATTSPPTTTSVIASTTTRESNRTIETTSASSSGTETTTSSGTEKQSTSASATPSRIASTGTTAQSTTQRSSAETPTAIAEQRTSTTKQDDTISTYTTSTTTVETTKSIPPPPIDEGPSRGPPDSLQDQSTTSSSWTSSEASPTLDNTITEQENITTREIISIKEGIKTLCSPNNITVFVNKEIMEQYEKQYGPLHFNNDDGQNCRGVEHEDYYRYTIAPNILGCGTQFTVNDTHVNFTNTVSNRNSHDEWYKDMLDESKRILIGRANMEPFPLIHMNFYCTFPLEMTVHTDLIPDLRVNVLSFNVSGVGQFSAIMQLFKDDEYRHPYFSAPSIAMSDWMRVGVTLLETKDDDISVAVRKCWATPVRNPDFDQYYDLIDDYCPIDGALNGNLTIIENGESKRAKFQGPVFKFVRYSEVWLHCEIKVCFGDRCNKVCLKQGPTRKRRGIRNHGTSGPVISAGPLFLRRTEREKVDRGSMPPDTGKAKDDTTIIIVISSLSAVVLLMCILFVVLFVKCRRRNRGNEKNIIASGSIDSSTLSRRRDHGPDGGRYEVRSSPVHNPAIDPELPPVPNMLDNGDFPLSVCVDNNCYVNHSMVCEDDAR